MKTTQTSYQESEYTSIQTESKPQTTKQENGINKDE